jgi:hypothetical protein
VLLPFALKALRNIPKEKRGVVVLSGLLGSFFPAYLFCIAETKIDSALAGIMNALTPLFVILTGISFFQLQVKKMQLIGIIVGFIGLSLLVAAGSNINLEYFSYSLLVLLATLFYGINVNMVGKHMQGIGSIEIASMAFVFLLIPCFSHFILHWLFCATLNRRCLFAIYRRICCFRNFWNRSGFRIILYVGKEGWGIIRFHGNLWNPLCCHWLGHLGRRASKPYSDYLLWNYFSRRLFSQ